MLATLADYVDILFAVDLDFDRYKVGSLKRSSYVGERMCASLNQLLNQFYQFKVNVFINGKGRRSIQRNERLLAVVSLSFGVGETNCLQGKYLRDSFLNF